MNDGGGEYFSSEFDVYSEIYGIIHKWSSQKKEYDILRNYKCHVNVL